MRKFFLALVLLVATCASAAFAEQMTFRNVSDGGNAADCCWTLAEGEVTSQTPATFRQFVASEQSRGVRFTEIRITGTGTDIDAAIELGRMFRELDAVTTIGTSQPYFDPWHERVDSGTCSDGCAIAFLGGKTRMVSPNTILALGQFHKERSFSVLASSTIEGGDQIRARVENQIKTGRIVEYLVEMGIDTRLYALATSVEPGSPDRKLQQEEIEGFGIENSNDRVGQWRAEPFGDGFVAAIKTKITGRTLMLYCLGDGKTYISLAYPGNEPTHLREALEMVDNEIKFNTQSGSAVARLENLLLTPDSRVFANFLIDRSGAEIVARAQNVDGAGLKSSTRNTDAFIAGLFRFNDIPGGSDLPLRVLKVCRR